jgi:hypothetical protein
MKNTLRNIGAVIAGFLTVAILSVVTDLILERVGILPPATQPEATMWWHLLMALIYRSVFTIIGGYLTTTLSATKPMRQVIILAVIGTVFGTLGTVANWNLAVQSGIWYPVVLLASSPFFIWVGGKLKVK